MKLEIIGVKVDNKGEGSDPEVTEIFSGPGLAVGVAIAVGLFIVIPIITAILVWWRLVS